jgi:hypothetical protein
MRAARFIFAILLAVSVALVPAAGVAAVTSHAMQASMPGRCAESCSMSCDKACAGCKNTAACALKCFNFSGAIYSAEILAPSGALFVRPFVEKSACPYDSTLPTRPPPV